MHIKTSPEAENRHQNDPKWWGHLVVLSMESATRMTLTLCF